jgi:uncharacterized membrane protein YdbT with pleckstrin-like domain
MSYVDDNLVEGETVEYRAHLHWVLYVRSALLIVLGVVLLLGGFGGPTWAWLGYAGAVVALVGVGWALSTWVKVASSEFAVTNRRVLIKIGLIQRHTLELMLNKVEGIGVDQGVLGRILNFGTIVVTGTGGTRESFANIGSPLEFRKHVQGRVPL